MYTYVCMYIQGFPGCANHKESNVGTGGEIGVIPELGRSPGVGNGNSLQYSRLGNPMDIGTWLVTVHRVTKSWTQLNTHACLHICIYTYMCTHIYTYTQYMHTYIYMYTYIYMHTHTPIFSKLFSPLFLHFVYLFIYFYFFPFIFNSWRLITLQYCSGFCHTLTWISHGFICVPHPDPPSHLPLASTLEFSSHFLWDFKKCRGWKRVLSPTPSLEGSIHNALPRDTAIQEQFRDLTSWLMVPESPSHWATDVFQGLIYTVVSTYTLETLFLNGW